MDHTTLGPTPKAPSCAEITSFALRQRMPLRYAAGLPLSTMEDLLMMTMFPFYYTCADGYQELPRTVSLNGTHLHSLIRKFVANSRKQCSHCPFQHGTRMLIHIRDILSPQCSIWPRSFSPRKPSSVPGLGCQRPPSISLASKGPVLTTDDTMA